MDCTFVEVFAERRSPAILVCGCGCGRGRALTRLDTAAMQAVARTGPFGS